MSSPSPSREDHSPRRRDSRDESPPREKDHHEEDRDRREHERSRERRDDRERRRDSPSRERERRDYSPEPRHRRDEDAVNPGTNLHVSGLSRRVREEDLHKKFSKYGKIREVKIVYDPHTNENRGFGFVTMETAEDAQEAMRHLDRTELDGCIIAVEKARRIRPRTPTPGRYLGAKPPRHSGGYPPYPAYPPRRAAPSYYDYYYGRGPVGPSGYRYDPYARYPAMPAGYGPAGYGDRYGGADRYGGGMDMRGMDVRGGSRGMDMRGGGMDDGRGRRGGSPSSYGGGSSYDQYSRSR